MNTLNFRPPTDKDFADFYRIYGDPRTNIFNPHGAMNQTEAEINFTGLLAHWQMHEFGVWVAEHEGKTIGFGGLSYRRYGKEEHINLGYRFSPEAWGKGFATTLGQYAVRYGFQQLGFASIYALVRPEHAASRRVLEKCGLQAVDVVHDIPDAAPSVIYRIDNPHSMSPFSA